MNESTANGSHDTFKNKWDLVSKHEATTTANRLQASQVILEALKHKRRSETSEWLGTLERESPVGEAIIAQSNQVGLLHTASAMQSTPEQLLMEQAIQWLDKMFVNFELFAADFNLNVRGTNLVVSCTRPIKHNNESTGHCISYAGHIATQLWSLIVRGCASKVEVFIIPAELLIAFSLNTTDESGYEPLLVIESTWQGNEIIWHVQDNVITADQIPALAKELFGDLIKVASGQMTEAEVIAQPIHTITGDNEPVLVSGKIPAQRSSANQLPLIDQLVNPQPALQQKISSADEQAIGSAFPNQANQHIVKPGIHSLKAAHQLVTLIETDIQVLLEAGKKALELDDGETFERLKDTTAKLEYMRKTLIAALSEIKQ